MPFIKRNIFKALMVLGGLMVIIAAAFYWKATHGAHRDFNTTAAEWSFISGSLMWIVGWWNRN